MSIVVVVWKTNICISNVFAIVLMSCKLEMIFCMFKKIESRNTNTDILNKKLYLVCNKYTEV